MKKLIDQLNETHHLSVSEYEALLSETDSDLYAYAAEKADAWRKKAYGDAVFIRGLIEISSYCKNDCLYCGLRRSNKNASRYRLTTKEILSCCRKGYELGFRTFVLQGGEDPFFTDERLIPIVRTIRNTFPDCAITLSLGERSFESYQALYDAGADRYLLRHETADPVHYGKLHPADLSLFHRMRCLTDLKQIGYHTGCGFMVGSPFQTPKELARDLMFIQEFRPAMCGIGPFIPHHETPFAGMPAGTLETTLFLLSLLRLIKPDLLLPATTALGTIHPQGRELGILAGANVIMPNLSPMDAREKYMIYDNKLITGAEDALHLDELKARMEDIGFRIVTDRGDPAEVPELSPGASAMTEDPELSEETTAASEDPITDLTGYFRIL